MSFAILTNKVWSERSVRGFRSAEEQAIGVMNIIDSGDELKAVDWLPNGKVGISTGAGQVLYVERQEAIDLGV